MATVYLARLSGVAGFQRLVAIKRLHPHLAREQEFVEMFLDEARLAARIHHPNVVPIQEVGESEEGYYLVMDYVEGDTLARVLARAAQADKQVPHGVTIRVLLDVLAGLHAAHELTDDLDQPLCIVHRDVSPQNILVGIDGVARLVDFGVARAASRLSTTRSGQLKGKLAYMAPEQARGGTLDRRADIFSCGIVLWEALALRRLFKGDGEAETLNRVLYEPIPLPSSARPGVPKALEALCMKALERDPDKRFATAQDFADELEKAARARSCVGSVRDVAQCLELVMGADLSQQREAVRGWLARSEPSHGSAPRSKPSLDSVTRIEGREGSGSRSAPAPVDRLAVTAPAPADAHERVSSVSSAVLQVPTASGTNPVVIVAPPRSRAPWIAAGVLAAAVVGAAFAWGAATWPDRGATAATAPATNPAAATAAPAPSAAPDPGPAVEASPAPAKPSADAAAHPDDGAEEEETRPAARHRRRHHGGGRSGSGTSGSAKKKPASSASSSPSAVPEDLLRNPYR